MLNSCGYGCMESQNILLILSDFSSTDLRSYQQAAGEKKKGVTRQVHADHHAGCDQNVGRNQVKILSNMLNLWHHR